MPILFIHMLVYYHFSWIKWHLQMLGLAVALRVETYMNLKIHTRPHLKSRGVSVITSSYVPIMTSQPVSSLQIWKIKEVFLCQI